MKSKREEVLNIFIKNKKAAIWEGELKDWILALIVVGIVFGGYMILSGKMSGAIEYVKNLFRFRG